MVHCIGSIPVTIIIIIVIRVMNHNSITSAMIASMIPVIIPSMVIKIIMTINADCHYCGHCKIGRVVSVIIRRIIGHIHR